MSKVIRCAEDLPEPIDGVIHLEPGTVFDTDPLILSFTGSLSFDVERYYQICTAAAVSKLENEMNDWLLKDTISCANHIYPDNQSNVASLISNH